MGPGSEGVLGEGNDTLVRVRIHHLPVLPSSLIGCTTLIFGGALQVGPARSLKQLQGTRIGRGTGTVTGTGVELTGPAVGDFLFVRGRQALKIPRSCLRWKAEPLGHPTCPARRVE